MYKETTEKNEVLDTVILEDIEDPTQEQNKIDKELDKCKFKSFGKVTFRPERTNFKVTQNLMMKKQSLIQSKKHMKNDKLIKIYAEILK